MMNPSDLLSTVAVVAALVAGGGLGLQRSRVSALKSDIDDERDRSQGLRLDVADLKLSEAEKSEHIIRLESDLQHAERMATGEQHWRELKRALDAHHQEAMRAWSGIKKDLMEIRKQLDRWDEEDSR